MNSSDNIFEEVLGKGTEGTEEYKAFELGNNIISIILNYRDGSSRSILYNSLASTGIICHSSGRHASILLTGAIYDLEGENLNQIQKLIQETKLAVINTLTEKYKRPTDDNAPIVTNITLRQLETKQDKD